MEMIRLDLWLYGSLARFASQRQKGAGHAHVPTEMHEGATIGDLLRQLALPAEEKGITFLNSQLIDMPGMAADLEMELKDGDRIAMFDRRSMWPFQYRFGASISAELAEGLKNRGGGALAHSPKLSSED
jgi:molybdopterin converting factor small subunit